MQATPPAIYATAGYARQDLLLLALTLTALMATSLIALLVVRSIRRHIANYRRASKEETERLEARQKAIADWAATEKLTVYVMGAQYDALIARHEAVLDRLGPGRVLGELQTDPLRRSLNEVRAHWQETTKPANTYNPADINRTLTRYTEIISRLVLMREQFEEARRAYDRLTAFCELSESHLDTQQGKLDELNCSIVSVTERLLAMHAEGFDVTAVQDRLPVLRGFITSTANRIAEGNLTEAAKELDRTASNLATTVAMADAVRERQAGLEADLPRLEAIIADMYAIMVTSMERYGSDGRSQVQNTLRAIRTAYDLAYGRLQAYETSLAEKEAARAETARTDLEALGATARQEYAMIKLY